MATTRFLFNPIGPPFDIASATGGPGSITITGNDDTPITATAFTIVGTGGLSFDWNNALSEFEISGNSSGITWNYVTLTTVAMLPGNGYITTAGSLTTLTLPATSVIGDTFNIINTGGGGIKIAQNAKQGILIGDAITTAGVGGYVSSSGTTQNYSSVTLVCVFSNAADNPAYIYAAIATVGIFGVN
jgi:hypothetical protein